jgi:hypothetical protein
MSAGAAVAAAAAARAAQQEEEEMTPYTSQDLAENWEFKILRSATGGFRDPVWLHGILQAESRAGWTIVEKFDDNRIRSSVRRRHAPATQHSVLMLTERGSAPVSPGWSYTF